MNQQLLVTAAYTMKWHEEEHRLALLPVLNQEWEITNQNTHQSLPAMAGSRVIGCQGHTAGSSVSEGNADLKEDPRYKRFELTGTG